MASDADARQVMCICRLIGLQEQATVYTVGARQAPSGYVAMSGRCQPAGSVSTAAVRKEELNLAGR